MSDLTSLIAGGVAGCVATLPMTLAMEAMHRQLPPEERYPLPPRQITENFAHEVGVNAYLDEGSRTHATMVAHFAYGAAMGALYGSLGTRLHIHEPARGALFGVGVWTGSYLGLLPSVGLLTPATQHPLRRNALMIAAHVVWGVATGLLLNVTTRDRRHRVRARPDTVVTRRERAQELPPGFAVRQSRRSIGRQRPTIRQSTNR